ncbi:MAG TPA: DUF2231 domain-containing protein [Rhizomicrobium sp.]
MALSTSRADAPVLLHPGFIGAGAALLIAAFVTDIMYCRTSLMQWANFSAWLIVFGLVLALVAAILLAIDFLTHRAGRLNWFHFILVAVAALLSLLNAFVHSRDAWTSVVPEGIVLSGIVTILLLIASFRGWSVTSVRLPMTGDYR